MAAVILALIRRDRLHVSHGLWWVAVAAGFVIVGLMPGIVDRVAGWLGIAYPPVLALIGALGLFTIKLLAMDIERSRIELRYQRLAQKVAILEAELDALRGDAGRG